MSEREFEIRTYVLDRYNRMRLLVVMDLETYNDALANYIEHIQDDYFNNGFSAAQDPYPTEEEIEEMVKKDADMDDDNPEKERGRNSNVDVVKLEPGESRETLHKETP